ncbi:MAG: hypothetical protein LC667_15195 [Thioalkalivibrio sp.]|nr:hypothetical protein [Thioalkalivibrio sp.]
MRFPAFACAALCVSGAISGCTGFSSVRSAEVHPGVAVRVQASAASPPGEGAAWFYNGDCYQCSAIPPAVEIGLEYGVRPGSGRAYSLGASINGFYPQLEGYLELHAAEQSASGIGARVGVPVWSWTSHELYGRYDRVLGPRTRLLYNPAVGLHIGNSPNGENPGHMLMLVQGVGLQWESRNITVGPSAALVLGTGRRTSYGDPTSFSTAFGTISASLTFHRARQP